MSGEEFPEDGEQGLVRPEHLPDRLDPDRPALDSQQGIRVLGQQPLPGIEGEYIADFPLIEVSELARPLVPPDVADRDLLSGDACLASRVLQIGQRNRVFPVVCACEVERAGVQVRADLFPLGDQLFVDGVELVGRAAYVVQPVPLNHGGFNERGGGVGVVLQHLGRVDAVEGQVEPAVDGRTFPLPCVLNGRNSGGRNAKFGVPLVVDDVLCCLQAHFLEFVGGLFENIDLRGAEGIKGRFVPVRAALGGMESKPLRLHDLLPVRPRVTAPPLHYSPAPSPPAAAP